VSSFVDSLSSRDAAIEVVVGQGRILTLKEDITAGGKAEALVAAGDPTVIDFVIINPRQIRLIGQRIGVTDLAITTSAGRTYTFEVRVVIDLDLLRAQLRCLFPDASVKLGQLRDQVVVEGQARDTAQVARIVEAVRAYLNSIQIGEAAKITGQTLSGRPFMPPAERAPRPGEAPKGDGHKGDGVKQASATQVPIPGLVAPSPAVPLPGVVTPFAGTPAYVSPELATLAAVQSTIAPIRILNLLRVPGPHQVLLKVRVAELNRTALRQIGGDLLTNNTSSGAIVGTQTGANTVSATATAANRMLTGTATLATSPATTGFGIFPEGDFAIFLAALRRNSVLKVLAEPNLVALNGQQATFLAGGQYPVPVPQFGAGAGAATVTVQFQNFGVQLGFTPFILDDDVIRLTVEPEFSEINFALATTLVPGGSPVPGLSTRRTHTTVEMRAGQTLMISGLLQLEMNGNTSRIPGLGDLPFIGPFLFSNTTMSRAETELVVMVTPYLIEPMNPDQVPPTPGDEVKEPNDLEFYFLHRIEARTGRDFRSTTKWDDPLHLRDLLHLESKNVCGPCGFAD
jgi:pilus assembly protein CpaC